MCCVLTRPGIQASAEFFYRHCTGQEERSPILIIGINIEKQGDVELGKNLISGLENNTYYKVVFCS